MADRQGLTYEREREVAVYHEGDGLVTITAGDPAAPETVKLPPEQAETVARGLAQAATAASRTTHGHS